MDIYIKGMEMPKSCHACCFFGQDYIWTSEFDGYPTSFCKCTGSQTLDYVEKFLPGCPLIPVSPHGRLVDLDKIENEIARLAPEDYTTGGIRLVLDYAPTVIPAEEKSDD